MKIENVKRLMWIPGMWFLFLYGVFKCKTYEELNEFGDVALVHGVYSGLQVGFILIWVLCL